METGEVIWDMLALHCHLGLVESVRVIRIDLLFSCLDCNIEKADKGGLDSAVVQSGRWPIVKYTALDEYRRVY